jgi:hypothetical protein
MKYSIKACLGMAVTPLTLLVIIQLDSFLRQNYTSGLKGSKFLNEITAEKNEISLPKQVKTSRQCSSVLSFIHSGTNVSLAASDLDDARMDHTGGTSSSSSNSNDISNNNTMINSWLPSLHDIWQKTIHPRLLPHVVDWVYSEIGDNMKVINQTKMKRDYQMVHNEFIPANLRKSIIHPMRTNEMQTLLRIIELRLADPTNNPPLEIAVFGPSVVEGYASKFNNWWIQDHNYNRRGVHTSCAWPARLEGMLNDVVFRGKKVVRVTNLGGGGTSSTGGALALEYRLFTDTNPIPDIVIHSYGNTDTSFVGGDTAALRIMQEFVLAAKKVRCNEDGLPYVILYDDFLGFTDGPHDLHFTMKNLRTVSQVADWYDVMAASYASAFRHTIMSGEGFDGTVAPNQEDILTNPAWDLPMLGWALEVHPAMLYHSTAPWVIAFNLLDSMVHFCQEYSTMLHYQPSYQKLSVDQIPAVVPKILLKDLPTKWKANIAAYEEMCKHAPVEGASPCSRNSWLVNKAGRTRTPAHMQKALSSMSMDSVQNWSTEGNRAGDGRPRIGWVATAANATFTITVKDTDHDGIMSMSIVAMKSYGRKWEKSRLRVRVWDQGKAGQGPQSQILDVEIEGVHDLPISVYFDHKFYLGTGGILKGNWVKAQFDLIGGTTFKIQGLLFWAW